MSDAAPDAGAEDWWVGADWTLGSEDTARIIGTAPGFPPPVGGVPMLPVSRTCPDLGLRGFP